MVGDSHAIDGLQIYLYTLQHKNMPNYIFILALEILYV